MWCERLCVRGVYFSSHPVLQALGLDPQAVLGANRPGGAAAANPLLQLFNNLQGGQAQPVQAAQPAAAPQQPAGPPVDEGALARLMEMGIGTEQMCRDALRAAGNDVDMAAGILFAQMEE